MTYLEIVLIAVGLAMDAFAVSICKGIKMRPFNVKQTIIIALFFGGAQAIMPLIGWFLGSQFEQYIIAFDHWIAFVLLGFIGGKMIWEAITEKGDGCGCDENGCEIKKFDVAELLVMAIATSIDALVIGATFAFLRVEIFSSISIIGVITAILCSLGAFIGFKFGAKFKNKAEILGGVVLVLMGTKILIEHLFF